MAVIEDPDIVLEEIRDGQDRLEDVHEKFEHPDVNRSLMKLVQRGDIALLPIGDSVVIRDESRTP